MKRDMDLVREILLKIEEANPMQNIDNLQVDGYGMQEVAYHCEMLFDAGLIKHYHGMRVKNIEGVVHFVVRDLTWEGQDFIETIRQDNIWSKTKKTITDKGLPMILNTVKTVSTAIISAATEGAVSAMMKNGGVQ